MRPDFPTWLPVPSPNSYVGRKEKVTGVVIHFTAAGSGKGTAEYFAKKTVSWTEIVEDKGKKLTVTKTADVSVSAHLVPDRDGTVYQCVPFEDRAWHAGPSKLWKGVPLKPGQNVNEWTIGIEIANWGELKMKPVSGGHSYVNYLGKPYKGATPFAYSEQTSDGVITKYWEPFPEPQVLAVIQAMKVIISKYPAITRADVLGHSDIDPKRKVDPGPAWPMERFLDDVFGDTEEEASLLNAAEDDDRNYDEASQMCLVGPKP